MDYEEEQKNEIEALESIYCNELQGKASSVGYKQVTECSLTGTNHCIGPHRSALVSVNINLSRTLLYGNYYYPWELSLPNAK